MPDFSIISKNEIIVGVRRAKNPKQQKKIYSQICLCSIEEIDKVLEEPPMSAKWTERDIKTLIKLIKQGESYEQIATDLVRTKTAVQQKVEELKAKGILPNVNKTKMKDISEGSEESGEDDKYRALVSEFEELQKQHLALLEECIVINPQEQCKLYHALGVIKGVAANTSPGISEPLMFSLAEIKSIIEKDGETDDGN